MLLPRGHVDRSARFGGNREPISSRRRRVWAIPRLCHPLDHNPGPSGYFLQPAGALPARVALPLSCQLTPRLLSTPTSVHGQHVSHQGIIPRSDFPISGGERFNSTNQHLAEKTSRHGLDLRSLDDGLCCCTTRHEQAMRVLTSLIFSISSC
jgi:hypothetical protein